MGRTQTQTRQTDPGDSKAQPSPECLQQNEDPLWFTSVCVCVCAMPRWLVGVVVGGGHTNWAHEHTTTTHLNCIHPPSPTRCTTTPTACPCTISRSRCTLAACWSDPPWTGTTTRCPAAASPPAAIKPNEGRWFHRLLVPRGEARRGRRRH